MKYFYSSPPDFIITINFIIYLIPNIFSFDSKYFYSINDSEILNAYDFETTQNFQNNNNYNNNSYSRNLRKMLKSELLSQNLDNNYYQKCRDSGEAYSASFLISKEHLIHQFTDYNLCSFNFIF
jgi:hypothetical protein